MPASEIEIVRRGYDAYARGDLEAMLADIDPELITYREEPDGATFQGRDGLLEAIREWVEDFSEFELTVEDLIEAPNGRVVAHVHQRAVGASSGAPIEGDFWFVHEIRDGQGVRLDMLTSKAKAFALAGLED